MIAFSFATNKEMGAALGFLPELPVLKEGESSVLEVPGFGPILVLVTGLTVINASFQLGAAMGRHEVSGVVNLGTAGSFQLEKHPLRSVVVINREIWPEYGLRTAFKIDPTGLGFFLDNVSQQKVIDRVELSPVEAAVQMGLHLDPDWTKDTSITVSGCSGSPERAKQLFDNYSAALENMEGFALAMCCNRLHVPFLEIRTVSNVVGSRKAEDWALKDSLGLLGKVAEVLFSRK
jgi:futalosine hydrolase